MRSPALARAAGTAWLLAATTLPAQDPAGASVPGSDLSIYVMTMGQGDQVWERFGHNAIGVRDRVTGMDVVYNWGLFSFAEPGFIGRFLRGDMMYWMGAQDYASTLAQYQYLNRTVEIQELNLSPAQRVAVVDFIRWNAREENKYYRYDYFLDNCSTRVRDALDRILGGALRGATDTAMTATTYRWHALRLMAEDRVTSAGIDIALGRPSDRPISQWEEMFIPMKVRDRLRELRVPDDSGRLVPLVTAERVAFRATRPPERDRPPATLFPLGLLGAGLGALVWWLARRGGARPALVAAVVGSVTLGTMGLVLLGLRYLTRHTAAWDNTNLLVYSPLWWLVAIALLAPRSATARRVAYLAASVAGGLAVVGLVAPFVPGFDQGSYPVILLAVPTAVATAWLVRQRTRPGESPPG